MGKRSDFARNPRDYYPTPYEAVEPLIRNLHWTTKTFVEPCAGDGRLIRHLERNGLTCVYACDIEPQGEGIDQQDVLFFGSSFPRSFPKYDAIITNPPWEREPLHEMIDRFRNDAPTWLLFDADWMFTGQAKPFLKFCQQIVSVGRVSWMENGTSGMDNCCWYNFVDHETETTFTA